MRYQLIIDIEREPVPGNANHIEALLANRNNKIKVLEAIKLD